MSFVMEMTVNAFYYLSEIIAQYYITGILVLIALSVLFQPTKPRKYASFVFAGAIWAHEIFLADADALTYYLSAGFFDFAVALILTGVNPLNKMVLRLQLINLAFIAVNFYGWVIWYLYLPPITYNIICGVLFTLSFLTLTQGIKPNVGGNKLDSWRSCVCFNRRALFFYNLKYARKIQK